MKWSIDFEEFITDTFSRLEDYEVDMIQWSWIYKNDYTCNVFKEHLENYSIYCDWMTHGCSKMVIHFEEYPDVVIKIPFKGERKLNYSNEDDLDSIDYDDLEYAEYPFGKDYCNQEYDNYLSAQYYNIEDIFAECAYFGEVNDIPIYVMKYCPDSLWYKVKPEVKEELVKKVRTTSVKVKHSKNYRNNEAFGYIDDLAENYSADFIIKVLDFIDKEDINDLHHENVRRADGHLVFIDYSGY